MPDEVEFSTWLMALGNGSLPTTHDCVLALIDVIKIPGQMMKPSVKELKWKVFGKGLIEDPSCKAILFVR